MAEKYSKFEKNKLDIQYSHIWEYLTTGILVLLGILSLLANRWFLAILLLGLAVLVGLSTKKLTIGKRRPYSMLFQPDSEKADPFIEETRGMMEYVYSGGNLASMD